MIKAEYVEIADAIDNNDWDEQSTIQTGKFSISQFQGTAFDSDYECYQVRWSEWASGDNVLLAKRIPCSLVVKKTESGEENILKILKQKGFPVPNIGPVLRYNNGRVMIFMAMLVSASSPLNPFPCPPHLLPCPHTHRIFPLRSCLAPMHLPCLLHSTPPLPVLGRLLFLTTCITWGWCFLPGEIRYAISYFFL